MPRFTGQNKKRVNPRYFLNETMDPRIAAMMTLKPGAQVRLTTGEVAEIVDVLEPGQVYEVAIDGGDEERTITIQDIDMSKLKAPGDLGETKKQPLKEAMIYVSPRAAKEINGMLGQAADGHKALVEMISYMDRYLGATARDFIGPASKDIMQIGQLMSKIIKEYQTKVKAHKRIEDPQQSAESGVDALQKLAEMDLAKLAAMDDRQITRIDTLMDSGEFDKAMEAIHPIKLYKIAKPYLLADEDEEVANAAPEMRKEILVQLIKSMPRAEAEEVYDLVADSLKARSTRRSSNKRFLDKMKSKFS